MEVKLCMLVYLSVSITTINKKFPQALFPITTSSLLKLAHHKMDGGKAWYTCVLQGFHDDDIKKWPQAVLSMTTPSLLKPTYTI